MILIKGQLVGPKAARPMHLHHNTVIEIAKMIGLAKPPEIAEITGRKLPMHNDITDNTKLPCFSSGTLVPWYPRTRDLVDSRRPVHLLPIAVHYFLSLTHNVPS